jgi:uncharacterized membrane protein YdbT with pleckstrin-like domain
MSTEARVPEAVIARLRPHARAMFWPSLALIAAIGAFFYFFGSFEQLWQNLAVAVGAVLAVIFLWMIPLLTWLGRHYTITTRRIVLRSGFFVRVRQELLHSRGYDVTVRQNSLQGMFGSGDVLINTGLENPVVLRDVPGADLVQSALHDLMESSTSAVAARRQQEQSVQQDETTRWGER